jgi:DHA1 family tetracycline resistance protein-like MFS transporter
VLALLNVIYGWFVLPESLSREHRRPFDWKRANPVGALALLGTRKGLIGLVSVYGLPCSPTRRSEHVRALHRAPLPLGRAHGGPDAGRGGACTIVVQGALVRLAVARMGERARCSG